VAPHLRAALVEDVWPQSIQAVCRNRTAGRWAGMTSDGCRMICLVSGPRRNWRPSIPVGGLYRSSKHRREGGGCWVWIREGGGA